MACLLLAIETRFAGQKAEPVLNCLRDAPKIVNYPFWHLAKLKCDLKRALKQSFTAILLLERTIERIIHAALTSLVDIWPMRLSRYLDESATRHNLPAHSMALDNRSSS